MHDAIDLRELAEWELIQLRETGFDVSEEERRLAELSPGTAEELGALLDDMAARSDRTGWSYVEPTAWDELAGTLTLPKASAPPTGEVLADRILGAWLGRVAGNMLGKPVEWGDHWTPAHLRSYLELAGAWPLDDYIPLMDPVPEGYRILPNSSQTTRGNVHGSSRDDDVDYTVLGLHLLEKHGPDLTPHDVADAWRLLLPLHQTYTAERVAYRNLAYGLRAPETATYRNPYREWIGAQIRGDAFGYVYPGDPARAARLAYQDAVLSHVANGVYGEMWAAALVAAAFTASSPREALEVSCAVVPPQSRLTEALRDVLDMHERGLSWEEARAGIGERYGQYSWIHTINNAAVVAAGLLWGDGDFTQTIVLTVLGGLDTDSNGATAGSVAGVLAGAKAIPSHWVDPLEDRLRSALFGFDGSRISELAARTTRLAETFGSN
ncbi:ADP-ribosylglycohydrolase family protein [Actinopolymorpha pittospori]|uniref:ADP-ribosylglycohydrolase n=1 Tax=Actinopolymorpha pittospori TaxID=648752 RepID=A0A927R9N9_9ACTN|nr:ADP-ribosylglycohydrolase family protein [Actinopolymorpha pittospori]MBE1606694.1 ADP-ribosylglycohydrolase [Actinopolymorpha pittospori]